MRNSIDITGQRFGFWVAVSPGEKSKNNQTQWLCKCECGIEKLVTLNSLRSGNSTSCGCNKSPNLINQQFGNLLVIRQNTNKNGRKCWVCQCACGNIHITSTHLLKNQQAICCDICKNNSTNIITGNISKYTSLQQQYQENVIIFNQKKEEFCMVQGELKKNVSDLKKNIKTISNIIKLLQPPLVV